LEKRCNFAKKKVRQNGKFQTTSGVGSAMGRDADMAARGHGLEAVFDGIPEAHVVENLEPVLKLIAKEHGATEEYKHGRI
jgi:hypothetical protein